MKYLNLTCAEPAGNLACDEVLLNLFEHERLDDGVLRLWQAENYFVVLGHSNRVASEVDQGKCDADGVPIFRRISGGGAVVQGPGCLNYSLILDCERYELRNIEATFRFVLSRHRDLLASVTAGKIALNGISDLTSDGRKFSGNAQYRKARYALVHGTFLLDFELTRIARYLKMPTKQPEYRENRAHMEFVTNLQLDEVWLCGGLRDRWQANAAFDGGLQAEIRRLANERYGRAEWSNKF